jgi:flagellar biogenesis protein FliO
MSLVGGPSEIVSVVSSLIVILAFLLAAAYLARRWQVGGRTRGQGAASIKIVAAQAIGWQSSLQIVEADGQRFLVAAGRGGITAIGRLTQAQGDGPSSSGS